MTDPLAPDSLMHHVCALADDIGPRPAGTPGEAAAQDYVRRQLESYGVDDVRTLRFKTPISWGFSIGAPLALAVAGSLLPFGRLARLIGAGASFYAAHQIWRTFAADRPAMARLAKQLPSSTQIAVIPAASGEARRKVVFVGHVDANKNRWSFKTPMKRFLRLGGTMLMVLPLLNGMVQLLRVVFPKHAPFRRAHRDSAIGILAMLAQTYGDEHGEWVDGANDNASAVACLLGLAQHFQANPLPNTEVWLAFTGAEESGNLGIHTLLDAYGSDLYDAYFVDFEMVGAGRLGYVTRHLSLSHVTGYTPDAESVAIAKQVDEENPVLGIEPRTLMVQEEVNVLRQRGYRAIGLYGYDARDFFPLNWHRNTDSSENIKPPTLTRAAKFAQAYAEKVDALPES